MISSLSHNRPLLLLAVSLLLVLRSLCASPLEEDFSEELLLRPLPDGKVLAHFHFTHRLPPVKAYGLHHRLFPKAVFQLIQKYRIREMELSFTQGRWNYNRWGGVHPLTSIMAKPSGVEMWAAFAVPDDQMDRTWGNLTHALSGLFCASLNFLESPEMTADPVRAFETEVTGSGIGAHGLGQSSSLSFVNQVDNVKVNSRSKSRGSVRYGALPREAVCTENLTPWLKLLPCRDKAGFATLFDRSTIYNGWYHSLRLRISSDEFREWTDEPQGTVLQQTLTLVMDSSSNSFPWHQAGEMLRPSWSLSSLFGRDLYGGCPLAKFSSVFMEFDKALMEQLDLHNLGVKVQHTNDICVDKSWDDEGIMTKELDCTSNLQNILPVFKHNHIFDIHGEPQDIKLQRKDNEDSYSSAVLAFSVPKDERKHSVNIGLTWKIPVSWDSPRAPFRVTRFLVGSGNERGTIALVLNSNLLEEVGLESECQMKLVNSTNVLLFQVVPWYIRTYFHTLKVFIDRKARTLTDIVKWMNVVPSEDRKSPGVIEMELIVPCNANIITLVIEFDKGFLRIDEHPPDANRGFDLPSAILHFSFQRTATKYNEPSVSNLISDSHLLREFQRQKPIQAYTESLLVPLATPDFSMPYNVITLTCTILALYFGSLLKVLRQRIGEEQRLARKKDASELGRFEQLLNKLLRIKPGTASRSLKIIKFVIVAVVAVIVNYYLSSS